MSSKNKKKKLKNSYQVPSGLKEGLYTGVKRLSFYTSSARRKLKEELKRKSAPQIDTLISIKNGIADTTYVYNFKKNKEE